MMKKHPLENYQNRKLAKTRTDNSYSIRIYHKKGTKRKVPRYLLKCGCCDEKVMIYYNKDTLEINGVNGSINNWREILLPLLGID